MNTHCLTALLVAILTALAVSAEAAEGSFKDWRNAMKAAEQAKNARDFQKMREILEESWPLAREHGPITSARNAYWLAIAYLRMDMNDKAIETLDLELEKIGPAPKSLKVQVLRGILLNERSLVEFRSRQYEKAMSTAQKAQGVLESAAGKYHPVLFDVYRTMGAIHALQKNFPEAEKSMKTALKLAQVITPGGFDDIDFIDNAASPERIIIAASALGQVYKIQGKLEEAEEAYETAWKSAQAAYPKDSLMRLIPLRSLAEVELMRGRTQEFNKHVDQTYDVLSKTPGLQPLNLRPMWLKIGLEADNQNVKGVIETVKKLEKVFELQSYDYADLPAGVMAAAISDEVVNWQRAETLQKALVELAESYSAPAAVKSGMIYVEIAKFAEANQKPQLAATMYDRALKSQQNAKDKGLLIGLLGKMAEEKIAAGKKAEALPIYHQVSVAMREKYGNDMRVADAIDVEAALAKELGDEAAATRLKAEAMEVRKKVVGK